MNLDIDYNPSRQDIMDLEKRLIEYNRHKADGYEYDQFIVKAMNSYDHVIAALHAQTGGSWLYISSLWVDEQYRCHGLGTKLLRQAEEVGLKKGCASAYLYTYSFQSPEFYIKAGFHEFGCLDNFFGSHSKIYMKKSLYS